MSASPVTATDRFTFTLLLALLIHALVLFGIRVVPPPEPPAASRLEVTLVPTRQVNAPRKADFLAASHQTGSGTLREVRELASVPGMLALRDGAATETLRRARASAAASEALRPATVTTRAASATRQPPPASAANAPASLTVGRRADRDADAEMARLSARLAAQRQDYARRPLVRTVAGVNARREVWAGYISTFRTQVEAVGNRDFAAGLRQSGLTGEVRLLVAIGQDGRVQRVQRLLSSGHAALDAAAEQSVWRAQPFPPFPSDLVKEADILQVVRTWRFARGLETVQ